MPVGGSFESFVHFAGGTKGTSIISSAVDSLDSEAAAVGSGVGAEGSTTGITVS